MQLIWDDVAEQQGRSSRAVRLFHIHENFNQQLTRLEVKQAVNSLTTEGSIKITTCQLDGVMLQINQDGGDA